MNINRVNKSIDKAIAALIEMKFFVEDFETPKEKVSSTLDFEKWPEAVSSYLICDTNDETSKIERARGIVEHIIDEDLENLKFLDFGCGEGHIAYYVAEKNAVTSIGYDKVPTQSWDKFTTRGNFSTTTDWKKVLEQGPYDVILCFDVLDHLVDIEPTSMLRQLYDALSKDGKIYLRTHPWTSRHATHLYHNFNKAYAHLVLTEDELIELVPDYKLEPNLKVQYPLKTYSNYFQQANLKVLSTEEVKTPVEDFFKQEDIVERIIKKSQMGEFPEFQMSIEFIDYVLCKP